MVDAQRTAVGSHLILLITLAAVLASDVAAAAPRDTLTRRSADPPAHSTRTVHLVPTPANVIEHCRRVQAVEHFRMLCPRLLPRAVIGWPPGQPPPPLEAGFVRPNPGRIDGVDIGYGAPWESEPLSLHRWRNRPCCFLHFVIQRGRPVTGARRAVLGGRSGRLLPARSSSYGGPYFANHVRFFFRERGVSYVATLHNFGERATTALLGRLIAQLRPVEALHPPPRTKRVVRLGSTGARAVAATPRALWILTREKPTNLTAPTPYVSAELLRLDPASGRIEARVRLAEYPRGLSIAAGSVWVAGARPVSATRSNGEVIRLDPPSGRLIAVIRTGTWAAALAAGKRGIWAVNSAPFFKQGTLVHIDTATNRLDGRPIALGPAPSAVAVGAGAVWVADALEGTVRRIDPARRRTVATIRVGSEPYALLFSAGSLWVTNSDDGTVSRVDPATNRVSATIRVGRNPYGIAAGARSLWVAGLGEGTVSRISVVSGRVKRVIRTGSDPLGIALAGKAIWVTQNTEGTATRLD